jgi:hypothetical protein
MGRNCWRIYKETHTDRDSRCDFCKEYVCGECAKEDRENDWTEWCRKCSLIYCKQCDRKHHRVHYYGDWDFAEADPESTEKWCYACKGSHHKRAMEYCNGCYEYSGKGSCGRYAGRPEDEYRKFYCNFCIRCEACNHTRIQYPERKWFTCWKGVNHIVCSKCTGIHVCPDDLVIPISK